MISTRKQKEMFYNIDSLEESLTIRSVNKEKSSEKTYQLLKGIVHI